MLSKQDYFGYLREMLDIETKMRDVYSRLAEKADDPQMKIFFSKLVQDETEHANAVTALIELIARKYPGSYK
jgi:rubrerythrin